MKKITNKKSIFSLFLVAALACFTLTACGGDKVDEEENNVPEVDTSRTYSFVMPNGMPALSMVDAFNTTEINGTTWDYKILTSPDLLPSTLLNGEADAAIIPANLGATIVNKDAGYKIAGIIGLGSQYVVSVDENIKSLEDLKGNTITAYGKGLIPDIMLNTALANKEIKAEDLTIEYVGAVSDASAALISGKAKTVLVTEPVLSAILKKVPEAKIVANLNDYVDSFVQTVLVVKDNLDDGTMAELVKLVEASVAKVKDPANLETIKAAATEKSINGAANIDENSLERLCLVGEKVNAENEAMLMDFYKALEQQDAKLIGGKVPENCFREVK